MKSTLTRLARPHTDIEPHTREVGLTEKFTHKVRDRKVAPCFSKKGPRRSELESKNDISFLVIWSSYPLHHDKLTQAFPPDIEILSETTGDE